MWRHSLPHLVAEDRGGVDDWPTEVEVCVQGHQHGGTGELSLQPAVLTAGVRAVGGVQGEAQAVQELVLQAERGGDHVLRVPLGRQLGSSPGTSFSLQLQIASHPGSVDVCLAT